MADALRRLQPTLPSPPACSADVARRRPRAETGCLLRRTETGFWVRWRTTDDFVVKTTAREFPSLVSALAELDKRTPIQSVLDAGANAGYSTVVFARSYPGAVVVAVEPHPSNYAMLTLNTRSFRNVVNIHAGVWGQPASQLRIVNGSRRIRNARGYEWQFRTSTASEPVNSGAATVAAGVTIPQLLGLAKLEHFDLVKLVRHRPRAAAWNALAHIARVPASRMLKAPNATCLVVPGPRPPPRMSAGCVACASCTLSRTTTSTVARKRLSSPFCATPGYEWSPRFPLGRRSTARSLRVAASSQWVGSACGCVRSGCGTLQSSLGIRR